MELIKQYFPEISGLQAAQFAQMEPLYSRWNESINVISRKDMEHFYERHVLHSLGIAKVIQFRPRTKILDVGTGGGFPGIPLAILFPECEFLLIDSIGKKIKVVNEVIAALELTNVKAVQTRAEEVKQRFDFVVSRAVAALPDFVRWVANNFNAVSQHPLCNGILYLKGGDLEAELKPVKKPITVYELSPYFDTPFFETKKVVHVGMIAFIIEKPNK